MSARGEGEAEGRTAEGYRCGKAKAEDEEAVRKRIVREQQG